MIKICIDKDTFDKAFNVYCKDLYTEELLINSFKKILDELEISYPKDEILETFD